MTTHDLRRTFISHMIVGLGLDPVRVARIAGHANVAVTLNTYAEEFDKAMHRDDLMQRIEKAGFGAVHWVAPDHESECQAVQQCRRRASARAE